MINSIKEEVVKFIYKVQLKKEEAGKIRQPFREVFGPDNKELKKTSSLSKNENPKETKKKNRQKIGRNDPCPCGSGLKYKHCCGKNR